MKVDVDTSRYTKHEVGRVYQSETGVYMLVDDEDGRMVFVELSTGHLASFWYDTLEEVDLCNQEDILIHRLVLEG